MRFRIFFLIFVLILFGWGCSQSQSSNNSITFAVGGSPNEVAFLEELAEEFKADTGITVNIQRQPTDTDQRRQGLIVPLQARKQDPDVFLMDIAWIPQFSESGYLEPIPEIQNGESGISTDPFFPNIIELSDRKDGRLIALPVYIDAGLLYYRKDLLKRRGYDKPPETWADLVEISMKVQLWERKSNKEFYAFVWQGAQYEGLVCNFIEFAGSNNGGVSIVDNRMIISTKENADAIKFMFDLIHEFEISPPNTFTEMKEEEVRTFFQQGNAVFERNWPYAWGLHNSEDSPVQGLVGIAPLPHFKGGKSVGTLGGWHIGISKFSDNKSGALKFIEFVTSYKTQKELALELGWNPGRRDVYEDPEVLKKNPQFKELKTVFKNAIPRPGIPYYSRISDVIQKHLNAYLSRGGDPEEVLKNIENESQKIIDRYEK